MIAAVKKSSKILSICSSSEYGRGKYLTNRRDPTTHAEMGAILKLRNTNVDLTKCCIISLKVSFNDKNEFRLGNGCPCLMCSKTIIKLGIRKCIYSDEDHLIKENTKDLLKHTKLSMGNWLLYHKPLRNYVLYLKSKDTYDRIIRGEKTIEIRKCVNTIQKINVGDIISIQVFTDNSDVKIIRKIRKKTLYKLLKSINYKKAVPFAKTFKEAYDYYRKNVYKKYTCNQGFVAFEITTKIT